MVGILFAFAFRALQPFLSTVPAKYQHVAPASAEAVANVDGVEIKAQDVENYLWQWRGADAVRELVEFQIVKAEADRQGIKVTPEEADAKLQESVKGLGQQLQGKSVDEALQAQGFTLSRAYLRICRQVMLEKIVGKDFHEADFVKVSAITIKPGEGKSLEKAIGEGQAAYTRLQKGEKWETVLASTSPDPSVAESGGLLGWRKYKIFPESVAKEFATLKPGGYTKPTQTTVGVQIFRLEAKGDQIPSEQVRELHDGYVGAGIPQLEKELRARAKVKSYAPGKQLS